jgi:decaprenylphospho-beta-D-ribofuranose 2-oxidase
VTVELISFDGTQSCLSTVCAPDGSRSLRDELDGEGPWAVRGAGLSYAQASAASGARTVSSRRLDRFLTFDPERLRLTVEPGVTVGDLVRYSVAHDLMFPVLPGHPAITLGGCAGFNVHGKAPHEDGLFADHVVALTLLHPDHGELTCGRDQHPDVFELTLGGMGLTGFITSLTLQLRPLPGRSLRRTLHPVANLVEAAALMSSLRNGSEDGAAMYAWNDLNPTGDRFGRGTVYVESYEDARLPSRVKYRSLAPVRRWPLRLAGIRPVTLAVNLGYRRRDRCNALLDRGSLRAVEDGAFPINGNEVYYRLFGRNGFREYQMVVPTAAWPAAAADVRRAIQTAGVPISLGSLKLFAGDPRLLWFRADGVCLTIDAAEGQGTRALFDRLDRVAVEHGAPVNLSKDSRVSAEVVRSVYAGYGEFRARLHDFDPNRRFRSMLRQRIGV